MVNGRNRTRAPDPDVGPGDPDGVDDPGRPQLSAQSPAQSLVQLSALRERESGENFPVALRLLPRAYRSDLHAIYAYARLVDETGDSWPGDRVARLGELADDLSLVWHGDRQPDHPVLRRLTATVAARGLSEEPFRRLLQANVQDQQVSRYATFADLRGYCRLSADPVGRIVLEVFHQATPEAVAASDEVCTALQLLEHWQDVGEDRQAGRVYLPQQDLAAWGVPEGDLDARSASPALRELMRFEIDRAAALLLGGARIVDLLRGWARLSVAGYVAGGLATVDALRATGGDVLGRPSTPSRRRTLLRAGGVLAGRSRSRLGGGGR